MSKIGKIAPHQRKSELNSLVYKLEKDTLDFVNSIPGGKIQNHDIFISSNSQNTKFESANNENNENVGNTGGYQNSNDQANKKAKKGKHRKNSKSEKPAKHSNHKKHLNDSSSDNSDFDVFDNEIKERSINLELEIDSSLDEENDKRNDGKAENSEKLEKKQEKSGSCFRSLSCELFVFIIVLSLELIHILYKRFHPVIPESLGDAVSDL
ncbi:hypothetical protein TRFO_38116 [Tritrichomonas foetus]|uniref:Uncharacterized protein n=1 Tax=Tritrichomonas foetus TaxID=1144522 RepID=A0A1J4J9D6_9EUKA|nr:hypothetical protein TRFO_38116 [Tritrichomonas foetus]|eukprot:OHS95760.1 hypothetical protein TRFO_38116 [Tritrichomonas foetus]